MSTNEIDYSKLDEGLGGAYERIAYSNIIKKYSKLYGCRSILELDATYIAGIPGFNSCLLAQDNFEVHVAVQARDILDAKDVWGITGLRDKVNIYEISSGSNTEFKDEQFDVVWNHLSFEQYRNPAKLVAEMKRISKKLVINLTLNPFNYGYWIHWLNHKLRGDKWEHGYTRGSTIEAIKAVYCKLGLDIIGYGACDTPPWMDTVNAIIGNSMTYADILPGKVREQWVWCSADPRCQNHKLVKLFWGWEERMPAWFKMLASHHLYVVSKKRN